ncbi:hypothetical protein CV_0765 [Chromobacterium violaceum ATCC 12472]|uniref:Uncharacterized protein n=1 Tax=Chromobacterium violaceum (strain ATCC 12472 / DSM 30191 / JCM 1249 / CCUG 213 / NBRC 12614 / NCIMB 9131 / NCTC 9757 / MK) TaxID=243365 RepID=Q7P004_CHRVO|nr:hypothetical protein CV_0765 [Chromobacterium violaceum ATCC 12472]
MRGDEAAVPSPRGYGFNASSGGEMVQFQRGETDILSDQMGVDFPIGEIGADFQCQRIEGGIQRRLD